MTEFHGVTPFKQTPCGKIYVTINRDSDNKIRQVFLRLGKAGGCATATTEAVGKLISHGLKRGLDPAKVVKSLKGIECHEATAHDKPSCITAVALCIEQELANDIEERPAEN